MTFPACPVSCRAGGPPPIVFLTPAISLIFTPQLRDEIAEAVESLALARPAPVEIRRRFMNEVGFAGLEEGFPQTAILPELGVQCLPQHSLLHRVPVRPGREITVRRRAVAAS